MLVAYAQTLYVALLAGGQTLSRMLRAARALPPGQGTAIFEFDQVLPTAEQRRFRDALRDAVDALGTKLTGALRRYNLLARIRSPDTVVHRAQPRSARICWLRNA